MILIKEFSKEELDAELVNMSKYEQVHKFIWLMAVINFISLNYLIYFFSGGMDDSTVTPWRWAAAVFIPILISSYGLKKKSLSKSGALLGIFVGFFLIICHWAFFWALLAFFLSSSKVTKYKAEEKRKIEGSEFKEGGQRNWLQVFCNGGVAFQICQVYVVSVGVAKDYPMDFFRLPFASFLSSAVLGSLACCNGDTWASEIGSVRPSPIHIWTWKPVPQGTNGGVTIVGLLASFAGGAFVGLFFWIGLLTVAESLAVTSAVPQWRLILLGGLAGLIGSIIDSLAGAFFQFSGWSEEHGCVVQEPGPNVKRISGYALLDNHTVNLLSSLATAAITPYIAMRMF